MKEPARKTVKRLFAVSGNQCAFPKCLTPLVDSDSGKVTGRICHIKGNRLGAKRYDTSQSGEERHRFDNLILLCPIHHDVIDDDEISYTVDRLRAMKSDHEHSTKAITEFTDDTVDQLLLSIEGNVINDGSVIVSHNQMGGQIAHSITNVGPIARRISETVQKRIAWDLLQLPPHEYEIEINHDDEDGNRYAYQITQILNTANWTCRTYAKSMFPRPIVGTSVSYPSHSPSVDKLISSLRGTGLTIEDKLLPALDHVHFLVGYRDDVA